jgi:hypothetical protein
VLKRLNDIYQKYFWYLSKIVLKEHAVFDDENLVFHLKKNPFPVPINIGQYTLNREKLEDSYFYRLNHTLGQEVLASSKDKKLEPAHISFRYDDVNPRVTGFRDYK